MILDDVSVGEAVWCHCHGMVRDGGMCPEGFCHPEPLDPKSDQDAPLIREHFDIREG